MDKYKYKISVIIPIYKVEKYIEETIKSVINQTIGFEKNIQLILVNDGSPDNSEAICLKYRDLYPNNVLYIKKENGGVSSARNEGLKHVEGKYVNFLDSDDKWKKDALKVLYRFLEKNYDSIDFVTCKMMFFDGRKSGHVLNYKYKKDKIVDIEKDYDYPQLSTCSALFKSEVITRYQYDSSIRYEEDAYLINHILQEKMKYGVVKNACYMYRKTRTKTSASQNSIMNESWYTTTVEKCYKDLFKESKKKYGKILKFYQYYVMYSLQWRIEKMDMSDLSTAVVNKYIKNLKTLLKDIDDEIIFQQKNINIELKCLALAAKYDTDCDSILKMDNNQIKYKNLKIKYDGFKVNTIYDYADRISLYGRTDYLLIPRKSKIGFINSKGEKIYASIYELGNDPQVESFESKVIDCFGFKIDVPVKVDTYKAFYEIGKKTFIIPITYVSSCPLNVALPYRVHKINKLFIQTKNDNFMVTKFNYFKRCYMELYNQLSVLKRGKVKAFVCRVLKSFRIFYRRPIWLISDRINMANDNGEALFKYIRKNHKEINAYFVVSKNSEAYNRLSKIGKVIDPARIKYKFLMLISKNIVSSHAEEYITNFAGDSKVYVQDLYNFKYTFLQHGITKDDLSSWINVNSRKIDLFITASPLERDSILEYNYHYPNEVVRLTGFARFDRLYSNEFKKEKKIIVMPTWRKNLSTSIDPKTGERAYNEEFKKSDFFKHYNDLLNNKKLNEALEKYGYKMKFCPHPNALPQLRDFKGNKNIELCDKEILYAQEFQECSMLITDYSSVFYDIGYLRKPAVYYQFDLDTIYDYQVYQKGYFSFEKWGFGDICKDLDSTVDAVIKCIKNDCKLDKKYDERVNKFFYKIDSNNCERVYNEIKKL